VELELSTDQEELRDSIRAVLAKESPVSLAREVIETGRYPDELWTTMTALGWPALTVPEEHGGIGLGPIEAGILAEELGRVIAPGPLLATVTQYVPVVRETATPEQQHGFLGAVARGEVRGALCLAESSGSYDPAEVAATATPDGKGFVLAGTKRFAIEAAAADELAVVVRVEGSTGDEGLTVVVVPGAEARSSPVRTLDGSRAVADVNLDGVRVGPERVLGTPGNAAPALRRAVEEAAVALALETVGTCQTIFDITLEYAKSRRQFGVPIGSFQAIKHKFADMLVALERGRSTRHLSALPILRCPHDRGGRRPAHARRRGRQGRGRRLPAPDRQGRHPDPRGHRLHVGARHASLRQAGQVERRVLRLHRVAPFPHRRAAGSLEVFGVATP
jgi:alkylation response protein AidB-like acyl-CoA dehydrogenase